MEAKTATYDDSKKLLLVCSECGEPVHLRKREIPWDTKYFAHPKTRANPKDLLYCDLRAQGGYYVAASSVVPGLSRGQLVDRFQREFGKEVFKLSGRSERYLHDFLEAISIQRLSDKERTRFCKVIQQTLEGCRSSRQASAYVDEEIADGFHDVLLYLKSGYGAWVADLLYRIAAFFSVSIHPRALLLLDLRSEFLLREPRLFCESFRLKAVATDLDFFVERYKQSLVVLTKVAWLIVYRILMGWRRKQRIPALIKIADNDLEIKAILHEAGKLRELTPRTARRLDSKEPPHHTPLPRRLVGKSRDRPQWKRDVSFKPAMPAQATVSLGGRPASISAGGSTPRTPPNSPESDIGTIAPATLARVPLIVPTLVSTPAATRPWPASQLRGDKLNLRVEGGRIAMDVLVLTRPWPTEASHPTATFDLVPGRLKPDPKRRAPPTSKSHKFQVQPGLQVAFQVPNIPITHFRHLGRVSGSCDEPPLEFVARIARRAVEYTVIEKPVHKVWWYMSDMDVLVDLRRGVFWCRESFSMADGAFHVFSIDGDFAIRRDLVYWR